MIGIQSNDKTINACNHPVRSSGCGSEELMMRRAVGATLGAFGQVEAAIVSERSWDADFPSSFPKKMVISQLARLVDPRVQAASSSSRPCLTQYEGIDDSCDLPGNDPLPKQVVTGNNHGLVSCPWLMILSMVNELI